MQNFLRRGPESGDCRGPSPEGLTAVLEWEGVCARPR